MRTDFEVAKVVKMQTRRETKGILCFSLNLCSSVKSVDVFLRNLRNLWFSLAKAEQLLIFAAAAA